MSTTIVSISPTGSALCHHQLNHWPCSHDVLTQSHYLHYPSGITLLISVHHSAMTAAISTLHCYLMALQHYQICYWLYTLCYWLYPLLLALPSATGSTLCYWLYPLLLALPSATGSTFSATGSTLCYWLYPLLLALPSTIIGYTLSTQDFTVPVMFSFKVM